MASKRFFSKTVKGAITEGKSLEEIYEELNGMSDEERETRISEIDAEIEEIARLMLNRQMNPKANVEKTEGLIVRAEKLKREKRTLELFPKVKKKLKKIAQLYRRAKKEKTRKQNIAQGKYMSLRAELRKKEEQIRKYDQEIEEAKEIAKTVKGLTAKKAMESAISSLEEEKAKISDLDELREKVAEAKAEFNVYNFRKSEEDQIMNKCRLPWELLSNGMDWKDISMISNQRLSEMVGMKRKEKIEPVPELTPEPELEPEQELEPPASGPVPPTPEPEQEPEPPAQGPVPPAPEPEQEPEPPAPEPEPGPIMISFSEKHPKLAKIKPFSLAIALGKAVDSISNFINKRPRLANIFKRKERAKAESGKIGARRKVVRESIEDIMAKIEEETDIRKLKGIEQMLLNAEKGAELKIEKLQKYPESQEPLREMINEDREKFSLEGASLKTLQSVSAIYIGQGTYTRKEIEELISRAATIEGVDPSTVGEMTTPDRGYVEALKSTLDKQKSYFLAKDIEEREAAWRISGISEEEIDKFRKIAQENQREEDKKIEGYKEDIELTKQRREKVRARIAEVEAGEDGEAPAEPSLREKGTDFRSRLKVGEEEKEEAVIQEIGATVTEIQRQQEEKEAGRELGDD